MFKFGILSACLLLSLAGTAIAQDQALSSDREGLRAIAKRHGFTYLPQNGVAAILSNDVVNLSFEMSSRKFVYGNTLIWLNDPAVKEGNDMTVARCDVLKTIEPLLDPSHILTNRPVLTVILDPGHGGMDTGAVGIRHEHEKKIVLDIAKRARKKLQAAGVNVRLTREKDQPLELADRTARARKLNADLFVSIHLNSAKNRSASGIETYLLPAAGFPSTAGTSNNLTSCGGNKFDPANILLAYYVHRSVVFKTNSTDRGIRHARFDVLKEMPCPAILVECGFISNGPEEDLLLQREYRDSISEGLAAGIIEYVNVSREK